MTDPGAGAPQQQPAQVTPPVTPATPPAVRRRGPSAGQIILIVIAIILLAGVAYMFWKIATRPVPVPSVIRQTHAEAAATLSAANLQLGTVSETATDDVAVGLIVSQDPAAGGSAPRDSKVAVWVAVKPTLVQPPDVKGKPKAEAEAAIRAALFVPVAYDQYSDTVPAGTVVSQIPRSDVPALTGSNVVILVSLGPGKGKTVPKVVGLTQQEAASEISKAGLSPMWLFNNVSGKPSGEVIDQAPEAGTVVPDTTPVAAVVVLPE